MDATLTNVSLPDPQFVEAQIASLEDELRALRRLLRASRAAAKAAEARKRREALSLMRGASSAH
jgi:hypothetical protein